MSPEERAKDILCNDNLDGLVGLERETLIAEIVSHIEVAVGEEREACLKACQRVCYIIAEGKEGGEGAAGRCCEAIRKRGGDD